MTHERDPRRPQPSTTGPVPGRPHNAPARNGFDALDAAGDGDLTPPRCSDYDALADLFLGEPDGVAAVRRAQRTPPSPPHRLTVLPSDAQPPSPSEPPTAPAPARIEGLIIGHLPVLASAWVTQYARHLAEQTNAWVGLVKARAGQVSVELVGPTAAAEPAIAPPSARETLDAALAEGARAARHWLIRVDELAEARLADLTGLDAVTLLTGADEAAVVASYRTLKLLGEHADGDTPSRLGVAIMGASTDTARDAAARLARTVQVHLGVTLPLNACVPRIGAGRSVTLFRGDLAGGTEAALPGIVGAIRSMAPAPATAPALAPEPIEPPTPAAGHGVAPARGEHPAATPPDAPGPTAAPESAPGGSPAVSSVALTAHLEGLRALPARCPTAPSVEIAVDAHGRVHLLADSATTNPVEQLFAASGWAALNRDWVALAAGGAAGSGAAVLHVFTSDARNARGLLDADVRVHLLVRTSVAGHLVTVCRPLN
ncbi:MAG: hypothetical protein ACKVU4_04150 [Phycisphaerales bacterium]